MTGMPEIDHFHLENGLEVVVIPDHRAPVVTHMVYYRNGAADDPQGKSGIAHFLEHLMFKGTDAHPKGVFSSLVSELGGQENAFTSYDYTAYYQRISKEHLGRMMALAILEHVFLILPLADSALWTWVFPQTEKPELANGAVGASARAAEEA